MFRMLAVVVFSLLAAGCTTLAPSPAVLADLAPDGRLRAAINFGNPILAVREAGTGDPRGVSVDLARELAKRLGVPLQLVTFESAGRVVAAVQQGVWDVAFLAVDPVRANELAFSPPYVVIEGAYLVRNDSPIRSRDEVDRPGVRIVVGNGSAYDLHLTRELKNGTLVRAPTSPAVTDTMLAQSLEVAAGVKQQLEADARRLPGLRILDGRFMVINQAMTTPRGREAGARYLQAFIEEMKASGFVARSLQQHNIEGASIAPAQR